MKFFCPQCRQPFLSENINVQTDLALCKACGHVAKLSQLVDADFDTKVVNDPPAGAWYRDVGYEQVFGATTRHASAFFLVPFMCVWSGFSLGGIYGTQIRSGVFNLTTSLFGIPFIIGSLLFWGIALMAICGKIEVRVRDGMGTVFAGVGAFGWKRKFDLDQVQAIEENSAKASYPGSYGSSIVLVGPRRFSFGSNLNESRRYFILNVLRQLKAKRPKLVMTR